MSKTQQETLSERNAKADAAYEKALAPARLSLGNPKRVPYPKAVKAALAAYDAVIEGYRA
jgi:hypothetical protein